MQSKNGLTQYNTTTESSINLDNKCEQNELIPWSKPTLTILTSKHFALGTASNPDNTNRS